MRWGIIGWILTLCWWLLYGNPNRPLWRLVLFTKYLTSALCLLRAWHRGSHQEGKLCVCHNCLAFRLFLRQGLQWPWQQWGVNRWLCGWSRRIKKTLILETNAQPNTSRIALLAAIFSISLQWLQLPSGLLSFLRSINTFEYCHRLDAALSMAWLCLIL